MREIKFRGQRINTKDWVYGYFVKMVLYSKRYNTIFTESGGQYGVIPETVGQFTGLRDKNGVDIYKGDIVKATLSNMVSQEITSVIDCENGCYGIRAIEDGILVDSKGKFKSFDGCNTSELIEVIGNIHDNPELLINN